MVEKHNTLITINCGTNFCILGYFIQVCNNAWFMPRFSKTSFYPFIFSVFLMNDTVNSEDNFCCTFLEVIKP